MPDKSNDTGSRIKNVGYSPRRAPSKHVFGTPEEIGARIGGTFRSLPDSSPTTFRQLGPKPAGGNTNDEGIKGRSGNQKYGNPRKYA